MDAITILATGVNITTGLASASATIPNTSASGIKPKYVRLACTAACRVKVGQVGVVAVAADMLLQPNDCVILAVSGCTTIAAIQDAAAGVLNIAPIENQ